MTIAIKFELILIENVKSMRAASQKFERFVKRARFNYDVVNEQIAFLWNPRKTVVKSFEIESLCPLHYGRTFNPHLRNVKIPDEADRNKFS